MKQTSEHRKLEAPRYDPLLACGFCFKSPTYMDGHSQPRKQSRHDQRHEVVTHYSVDSSLLFCYAGEPSAWQWRSDDPAGSTSQYIFTLGHSQLKLSVRSIECPRERHSRRLSTYQM